MRLLLLHAIDFHTGQHIFPHPKAYIKQVIKLFVFFLLILAEAVTPRQLRQAKNFITQEKQ